MIWWQHAMIGAASNPFPQALLPLADLDEAAVDIAAAAEWAASIATVAKTTQNMLEKVVAKTGIEHAELEKWRNILPCLQSALEYAEEHVAALQREASAGRT
jgi:hypothetical protein